MKKILILALCLVAVSMAGCKKNNKTQNGGTSTPAPTSATVIENGAIGVTEEGGKVRVNMPKAAFGENTAQMAEQIKNSRGFEAAEVQADGSVTFVMTKAQHKKWLDETEDNAEDTAERVIEDFRSLDDVEFNRDLTEAVIEVEGPLFDSKLEKGAAQGVANAAFIYQSMNGVKKENLKVIVKFVDDETKAVLETVEVLGNK